MKQIFMLLAVTAFLSAQSQPVLKQKTTPSIQPFLNEVVQDFFQNFNNLKGDTISKDGSLVTFESKLKFPGAIECTINKYATPNTYSWQALMAETEDFNVAAELYNKYFKQLNKSKLAPNGFEKFSLIGNYDVPDDGRGFASTYLRLDAPKKPWDHFIVDLGMQYLFPNWQVKIMVYEKVPDDEIRPGDY